MQKIKRHINVSVPIETCNLRCNYCYITQMRAFSKKIEQLPHSTEFIAKAFRKERFGGICHINLCAGGETLLSTEVLELTKLLLLEGHFVTLVTNGTIKNSIDYLCNLPPDLGKRLFVKFSFHYLELKRLNLLNLFFDNVEKIKKSMVSFTVELTANDLTIPYIDEIKDICLQRLGALCHIIESRNHIHADVPRLTGLPVEEHQKVWGEFASPLFEFQQTTWGIKREEFCYAGEYMLHLHLGTGRIFQCFSGQVIGNLYENIDEPIHFCAIGRQCPWPHCYSSYVWLTLGGAIPELTTPYYSKLRNKICKDGTEWLKPEVKYFFSSKPQESNARYHIEKEWFVDALIKISYGFSLDEATTKKVKGILIQQLKEKQLHNIALYAMGRKGKWVYDLLKDTDIKIVYTYDKEWESMAKEYKCSAPFSKDELDVDAIIILNWEHFHVIQAEFQNRNIFNTFHILELFPNEKEV